MVTQAEADANPEEYLGRDITLTPDDDLKIGTNDDYAIVRGRANLQQAIVNRLRTARGELTLHPNYGSKLHTILGTNPKNDTLILAKMYVIEALNQEPRIASIDKISCVFRDNLKTIIDISITITPIKNLDPLNIIYSVYLTGQVKLTNVAVQ